MSLKNKYNYYKAFKNMQNKKYEKAIFYFKKPTPIDFKKFYCISIIFILLCFIFFKPK